MALIVFKDFPSMETPLNAENLNNNFNELNTQIAGIIESGSNENGEYVKFSDGTMIQSMKVSTTINIQGVWGSLFHEYASLPNYPIPFVGNLPTVVGSIIATSSTFCFGELTTTTNSPQTLSSPGAYLVLRPTAAENVSFVVNIIAKGRWK